MEQMERFGGGCRWYRFGRRIIRFVTMVPVRCTENGDSKESVSRKVTALAFVFQVTGTMDLTKEFWVRRVVKVMFMGDQRQDKSSWRGVLEESELTTNFKQVLKWSKGEYISGKILSHKEANRTIPMAHFIMEMFLFIVAQGLFSESNGQKWSFSFPFHIKALTGSCVEIPCLFTHPNDSVNYHVVWYRFSTTGHFEILNSKDSSSVHIKYRGRTSLVRSQTNSCTLRINNVTGEDSSDLFPGIDEKINAHAIESKLIRLSTTDIPDKPKLVMHGRTTKGSPKSFICYADYTCPSNPPSLQWNKADHPVRKRYTDLKKGYWRVDSELTSSHSYEDQGTKIQCTAIYTNGKKSQNITSENLFHAEEKNVTTTVKNLTTAKNKAVPLILGCLALLSILLLLLYVWIRKRKKKRASSDEINATQGTTSSNNIYSHLQKRYSLEYSEFEPESYPQVTGNGTNVVGTEIYENIQSKFP
ncbi:B-cell receptor CD22-like [Discoglossus pictus]